MRALYLESSVALSWLLQEPRALSFVPLINQQEIIATSVLTLTEVKRALARLSFLDEIDEALAQKAAGYLERVTATWRILEMAPEILARAGRPFPVEPVRTLDAIHLSTMLELLKIHPDLGVLTFDKRIRENLSPLGLVFMGNNEPVLGE